jgi:hypothetical protein
VEKVISKARVRGYRVPQRPASLTAAHPSCRTAALAPRGSGPSPHCGAASG